MTKVRVKTETTYIVDLPIDSFEEISTDKMSIKESDKFIIEYLSEKYDIGVDKIIGVKPLE